MDNARFVVVVVVAVAVAVVCPISTLLLSPRSGWPAVVLMVLLLLTCVLSSSSLF